MDDIERARRILADPCGLMLPGNLGKVLLARIDELKESEEALLQKLDTLAPHGTCGCSYDRPGDYCMHHSPALMKERARVAELEAERAAHEAERTREASRPALDRALDRLGYAIDKARNGE